MKRWPTKPLRELITIEKGKKAPAVFPAPTKTSPRYLQIEDLRPDAGLKYCEPFKCPRATKSDVILAWDGANAGTVSCNLEGHIGSTLAILRPVGIDTLSAVFLSRFLQGNFEYLQTTATGATIPHVSKDALNSLQIPVPPLAEQERIVKLLDEADELRKLRAQADRRAAALIPALFHEMFGDPITNSKGWPQSSFAEVGKLDRGRSKNRPRDESSLYGGKYPFIQTGDVANSNGEITAYTQTYSEKGLAQSRTWPAGTLCITIAANIGKTAILTFSACFPDSMVGFVPGEKVVVDYVRQWLVTMESRLEEAAPQMAQKNINLKILSELTIPVPPLPLQKEFAARVAEIREMKFAQSASCKRLDDLFQSMLHRAFEGEL